MTYDNKFGVLVGLWSDIDIEVAHTLKYGLNPSRIVRMYNLCTLILSSLYLA